MKLGLLLLLLFTACLPTTPDGAIPYGPTPVTVSAAERALTCGRTHGLVEFHTVASIKLYVVPGGGFIVNGEPASAFGRSGYIYVATDFQNSEVVWAHEYLHQLYNLPGKNYETHPLIFFECGLLTPR